MFKLLLIGAIALVPLYIDGVAATVAAFLYAAALIALVAKEAR